MSAFIKYSKCSELENTPKSKEIVIPRKQATKQVDIIL